MLPGKDLTGQAPAPNLRLIAFLKRPALCDGCLKAHFTFIKPTFLQSDGGR